MSNTDHGLAVLTNRTKARPFTFLFVSLLALIILPPLLPYRPLVGHVPGLLFSVSMIAALFVLARRSSELWLALGLFLPAAVLQWLSVTGPAAALVVGNAVTILFFLLVGLGILRYILRAEVVDREVILSALCAFLVFGIVWAQAYELVAFFDPGAFFIPDGMIEASFNPGRAIGDVLTYFSFVTLTTLGFGDVQPISPPAQSLAVGEAIVGQLYLVTMIARLVSIQVTADVERSVGDEAGN